MNIVDGFAGRAIDRAGRAIDGLSFAALRMLFSGGLSAAREVLGATLDAAPRTGQHSATPLDMIRAFPVREDITLDGSGWFEGSTDPCERLLFAQLVRFLKPRFCLEIGTFRGTTTRLLLDHLPPQAKVYTMDLPAECNPRRNVIGLEYRDHPRASDVIQVFGNTFDAKTWDQVPENIEFAFIDGDHSYEAVRNDSEWCYRKMDPNGVILWHDYGRGEGGGCGVGRYIRQQMKARDDVFICTNTSLALRIPVAILREGEKQIARFCRSGDYSESHPRGPFPWLRQGAAGWRQSTPPASY